MHRCFLRFLPSASTSLQNLCGESSDRARGIQAHAGMGKTQFSVQRGGRAALSYTRNFYKGHLPGKNAHAREEEDGWVELGKRFGFW